MSKNPLRTHCLIMMLLAALTLAASAQDKKTTPPQVEMGQALHPRDLVETLLAEPGTLLPAGVKEAEVAEILTPLVLRLDDGTTVVLRGLSIPEGERFREMALNYVRSKALGKRARLVAEIPPITPGSKVYAYVSSSFLNESMVRYGYAMAVPDELTSETIRTRFLDAQRQAETRKLGIWSKLAP